jgi:hypothetical protein
MVGLGGETVLAHVVVRVEEVEHVPVLYLDAAHVRGAEPLLALSGRLCSEHRRQPGRQCGVVVMTGRCTGEPGVVGQVWEAQGIA